MTEETELAGLRIAPLAVVGFIFACIFPTAPIGLALCLVALSEIKGNPSSLRGAGLAKWGIGLSVASLAWISICGIAYMNHLHCYKEELASMEQTLAANAKGFNGDQMQENIVFYEKCRNNPPSFLNPFKD